MFSAVYVHGVWCAVYASWICGCWTTCNGGRGGGEQCQQYSASRTTIPSRRWLLDVQYACCCASGGGQGVQDVCVLWTMWAAAAAVVFEPMTCGWGSHVAGGASMQGRARSAYCGCASASIWSTCLCACPTSNVGPKESCSSAKACTHPSAQSSSSRDNSLMWGPVQRRATPQPFTTPGGCVLLMRQCLVEAWVGRECLSSSWLAVLTLHWVTCSLHTQPAHDFVCAYRVV